MKSFIIEEGFCIDCSIAEFGRNCIKFPPPLNPLPQGGVPSYDGYHALESILRHRLSPHHYDSHRSTLLRTAELHTMGWHVHRWMVFDLYCIGGTAEFCRSPITRQNKTYSGTKYINRMVCPYAKRGNLHRLGTKPLQYSARGGMVCSCDFCVLPSTLP